MEKGRRNGVIGALGEVGYEVKALGVDGPARADTRDWGFFRYKKRSISIQDIIIYHHISCRYHDISLCIMYDIMYIMSLAET